VLETDRGPLPLLRFPVIGFFGNAEAVYAGIVPGKAISVRIGQWPPAQYSDRTLEFRKQLSQDHPWIL
jgi:hypothetical protein